MSGLLNEELLPFRKEVVMASLYNDLFGADLVLLLRRGGLEEPENNSMPDSINAVAENGEFVEFKLCSAKRRGTIRHRVLEASPRADVMFVCSLRLIIKRDDFKSLVNDVINNKDGQRMRGKTLVLINNDGSLLSRKLTEAGEIPTSVSRLMDNAHKTGIPNSHLNHIVSLEKHNAQEKIPLDEHKKAFGIPLGVDGGRTNMMSNKNMQSNTAATEVRKIGPSDRWNNENFTPEDNMSMEFPKDAGCESTCVHCPLLEFGEAIEPQLIYDESYASDNGDCQTPVGIAPMLFNVSKYCKRM